MERVDLEKCPACGAGSASCLHQRNFRGKSWALARCPKCGLHFTSPTPTEEDLESFYAGDYHAALRGEGGTEAAFGSKYRRYADTVARHLSSGRVIDVGCSTGLLVRALRDRGYDAEGIELNRRSAAWGREHYGVPIHTEPLERCAFEAGSLSAILLTDVLEHTRHPREFLRGVGRLLAPGGFVLVTFPDIRSIESCFQRLLARALGRDWLWNSCHIPLHVWEFTPRTAKACFEDAGFRIVEFRRNQPVPDPPDPVSGPRSWGTRLLEIPMGFLRWPGIGQRLGTQMEFVIQKIAEPAEMESAGERSARAMRRLMVGESYAA